MTMKASQTNHIGVRLKEFRKQAKMTQGELATAIGKSLRTIQGYESGSINLSLDVVEQIAQALGVSYYALIGIDSPDYLLHDRALTQEEQLLLADYRIVGDSRCTVVSEFLQHSRFWNPSWEWPNLSVEDYYKVFGYIDRLIESNIQANRYFINASPTDEDGVMVTEQRWNEYYNNKYNPRYVGNDAEEQTE